MKFWILMGKYDPFSLFISIFSMQLPRFCCSSFKRIVEYTADEHNGFNAVVRREPVDAKIVKKVYEPEYVKHHLAPANLVGPVPVPAPAPLKYYNAHQQVPETIFAPAPAPIHAALPVQKHYAPAILHHQGIKAPQQFIPAPQQYYAPPENPKFFKPIQKITKYFKPAHEYEPQHTGVRYVSPSPAPSHYNYNQY